MGRAFPGEILMTDTTITTSYGVMPAYVARPQGSGPWPGVVVIHDAGGLSKDTRRQADWLAGAGYLAVAPHLFYWGGQIRCLVAVFREVMAEPRTRGVRPGSARGADAWGG